MLVDERGKPFGATVLARDCKYDRSKLYGVPNECEAGEAPADSAIAMSALVTPAIAETTANGRAVSGPSICGSKARR